MGEVGELLGDVGVAAEGGVLVAEGGLGVEWPMRAMSSARVAPVRAARTAPVWRRS